MDHGDAKRAEWARGAAQADAEWYARNNVQPPRRYYLAFLLDLANEHQRVVGGKVAYAPTPDLLIRNAFHWKIICYADGVVTVHATAANDTEVIATARWANDDLASCHQRSPLLPTSYQWELVEATLRSELAKCVVNGAPDSNVTENVSEIEARFERRKRDWSQRFASIPKARRRKLGWVALGAIVAVLVILLVAGVFRRSATTDESATQRAQPVVVDVLNLPSLPPFIPTPPTEPAIAPPEIRIAKAESLAAAIAITKPEMTDSTAELDGGARLLASYASRHLRWADLDVPAETTIGRVEKDPEPERGKRLCATGELLRIERRDLDARKVYVGSLRTGEHDNLKFVAVGSTGDLVKRSTATLCGVVIGKSADAVSVVGMFDLPENRHPAVEQ